MNLRYLFHSGYKIYWRECLYVPTIFKILFFLLKNIILLHCKPFREWYQSQVRIVTQSDIYWAERRHWLPSLAEGMQTPGWSMYIHKLILLRKNELGLLSGQGHKNESILLTNWFFFWIASFLSGFKKTEMNKAQKTSIWPTMHFRDDIFDSFLSSCTTYDE